MGGRRVHLASVEPTTSGSIRRKSEGKDDVTGEDLIQRDDDHEDTVIKRLQSLSFADPAADRLLRCVVRQRRRQGAQVPQDCWRRQCRSDQTGDACCLELIVVIPGSAFLSVSFAGMASSGSLRRAAPEIPDAEPGQPERGKIAGCPGRDDQRKPPQALDRTPAHPVRRFAARKVQGDAHDQQGRRQFGVERRPAGLGFVI